MNPKKIIFTSNTSMSLYKFRLNIIKSLTQKGFCVVLCAAEDEYSQRLKKEGLRIIPINLSRKGINIFHDIKLMMYLFHIYKRERPDLVYNFSIKPNIYSSLAAAFNRIACVNTVSGMGSLFVQNNLLTHIVRQMYRISFKFTKKVIFQNQYDLDFFINSIHLKKDKAVLTSGSGVNLDYFNPSFCQNFTQSKKNFTFLFIGRLIRHKGIDELIAASKIIKDKHKNVQINLLGRIDLGNPSGITKRTIYKLTKEGLINYFGAHDDVRPFICEADAIVLPSYREGVPRALLESMAMEKPIITTNAIGCSEVIEDGKNGFSIPAKNAKALVEAMSKLINLDPDKIKRMGKYGRQKAATEFNEQNVIQRYVSLADEIL
jgi:glycosyltransferase involved in cell wall biosynthesis